MDQRNNRPPQPEPDPGGRGAFESPAELGQFYERLAGLLRDGPVGIAGLDRGRRVRYWSRSCEGILGYPAREVVGHLKLDDFSGEALSLDEDVTDSAPTGHLLREGVFVHKDGSPRILHLIVLPVFIGADLRHEGFTVCLLDVTERREAEEALRRERNTLNLVLDTMGAGVALFDSRDRLQWANSTLSDWFGGPDGELKGLLCNEVFCCSNQRCEQCALEKVKSSGKVQSSEIERTDDGGQWHCFHQLATPLELGRRQYLMLTLDVTEERRRKEQMRIVNDLARALTRSLDPHKVQHLVLTCVTAGHALGFNRAFLLLLDDETARLEGSMAVGPMSAQEANRIWEEVSQNVAGLEELLERGELADSDRELSEIIRSYSVRLDNESSILARSVRNMETVLIMEDDSEACIEAELKELLGLREVVISPLVAKGKAIGALLADNRFSGDPIRREQVQLLEEFAAQASLAIENALAYRRLRDKMQELEKTQGRLVEAERLASVGRMAAHLAHEIRNPLTTVGGFAKSIERNSEKPDIVRRNAAIIYREALRLENVLNDALDFSRPITIHKTKLQINDLLRDIANEYAEALEKRSIKLRLDLDETLPELQADEFQVKQVIINLIHNAFDALENSRKKFLLFGTSRTGDEVVVSVCDSGQGMDEKTLKALFAPFFTTKKGGSGLGLAICRKIMIEHGGDISVDSSPGKGTAFYLLFPEYGLF